MEQKRRPQRSVDSQVVARAAEIWSYLSSFDSHHPADAVVACCSDEIRVCDRACNLVRWGFAAELVLWERNEDAAKRLGASQDIAVFQRRINCARSRGVAIDYDARGSLTDVRPRLPRLAESGSVIFVTDPPAVLELKLAVRAHWPEIESHVSCPTLRFPDVSDVVGISGAIHSMVPSINRMAERPDEDREHHRFPNRILEHRVT